MRNLKKRMKEVFIPSLFIILYQRIINFTKKPLHTQKGDLLSPIIVPLVFLILVVVTSIIIVAWQTTTPILQGLFTQFNVPANYQAATIGVGNNLYSFNFYLPLIFYFVMIAILVSTIFLNADPVAWLVGIIYLPFIYYITIWISNIAHNILGQAILAQGISHLPLSVQIFANLPTISLLFAGAYIVLLCIRVLFFQQGALAARNPGSRGLGYE